MTGAATQRTGAIDYLASQQHAGGSWEAEVSWCPMITAQYVIVQRITGRELSTETRDGIVRYFRTTQIATGGWGLHRESGPYVFITTLVYVALRLLGVAPDDPVAAPARRWLRSQPGGVLAIPTWGKFWLALIGCYEYAGVNPCPPEAFLLPAWMPVHPIHFYCHTRYIYLGIAYLYGRRVRADLGPIVHELRRELYDAPYESIDFAAHRHDLAATDVYVRPGFVLRRIYDVLTIWERVCPRWLRRRALDRCFTRILYEQRTSRYQGLSPVNGLLNDLAIWAENPQHADRAPGLAGVETWKWEEPEQGIRFAGARSNTWDTAFAMQAILDSPRAASCREPLVRAYDFLRQAQMTNELPGFRAEHRDPALGGWCFSDGRHQWPVSDCTAEALSAVLGMHDRKEVMAGVERISDNRLAAAAVFILSRQNSDGGFGTYERRRGLAFLEKINPSEMFGNCMTERSYTECTGSCVRALAQFRSAYPDEFRNEIGRAIRRGVRFLRSCQRADGSFPGFWGINFTYAAFFVVEGLRAAGVPVDDPALERAAAWLIARQRTDGGWGEHYSSCLEGRYVEHSQSQVAMTSWALLALIEILGAGAEPVKRGIAWLRARQRPDGSWPRQSVNGVFFGSAMLDYGLYETYFPAWALAKFEREGRHGC
ncbi:MAG TPA: 2,3-oxidosqualene cyclase [Bryobacteraceae bacterium]|nr:2,3-oxidosqualene cyclase [Bryobacteraceae bacterium]